MFNRHHKTVHFLSLCALKTPPNLEMHIVTHLDNILPLKTCPDIVRHICTLFFFADKKSNYNLLQSHTGLLLNSQSDLCPFLYKVVSNSFKL